MSDPWSLYTFQNNPDGKQVETRMDAPCQHLYQYISLITLVHNGKELLAVSCRECKDIKLVDMETKQVTPVFKSPTDSLWRMCSGTGGSLFVSFKSGNLLQLDSSFNVTNTFDLNGSRICYLPPPHNTLVIKNQCELRAVSLQDGHQVWSRLWMKCTTDMLYCPQQDVLLVSLWRKPWFCVVNPMDGSMVQTFEIPNIPHIRAMCLCNDQIVMVKQSEVTGDWHVSYYRLKRIG